MILVTRPVFSTVIFAVIFITSLLLSVRKKSSKDIFPLELTTELKGFAILAIVFSHIGYILSSTDRFLWPLSILAGVGVNLFLFLSGYGLSISGLKKQPSAKSYIQRLLKLFVPLWIVLVAYFLLDYFVLHISYENFYVFKSLAGIFLRADALNDVNSVLWYFSIVLFYYVLFPIIFMRKRLWVSATILIIISTFIVRQDPVVLHDVMRLYQVHTLAFPLGMLVAWASTTGAIKRIALHYKRYENTIRSAKNGKLAAEAIYVSALIMLSCAIGYFAVNSSVGTLPIKEQLTSLLTTFLIIILFIVKKFQFRLLTLFGFVSFEIYLLHWPLLSRYDVLYAHVPAWLATALYFVVFLTLGYALKIAADKLTKLIYSNIGRGKSNIKTT